MVGGEVFEMVVRLKIGVCYCYRLGRYCGSLVIWDLFEFYGLVMSEVCCFGFGVGFGIIYVEIVVFNIFFIVYVCLMEFEEKVFNILDVFFFLV